MAATMKPALEAAIRDVITQKMDRVMQRVLVEDPFNTVDHRRKKPLYAALVPDDIFKASHFERQFVTPFGKIWEELAVVVAKDRMGNARQEEMVDGVILKERLVRIQEVLNSLEHKSRARTRPTSFLY